MKKSQILQHTHYTPTAKHINISWEHFFWVLVFKKHNMTCSKYVGFHHFGDLFDSSTFLLYLTWDLDYNVMHLIYMYMNWCMKKMIMQVNVEYLLVYGKKVQVSF